MYFLLKCLLVFATLFFSSCRFWQTPVDSNIPSNVADVETGIPFSTKEPETYQAELVTKFDEDEELTFIAHSRGRFFQRKGETAILKTEPNKTFLLDFGKKIYAENVEKAALPKEVSGETLNDFLTTEWLNQKAVADFENLGEENGLTKYRAVFDNSETLIFVDGKIKMPVRQEFYSTVGEAKNLLYSTELRNIKLIVDEQMFQIPVDFQRVSLEEFHKESR